MHTTLCSHNYRPQLFLLLSFLFNSQIYPQNHREQLRMKRTTCDHLLPTRLLQSGLSNTLHRTTPRQVLTISRVPESTPSLGNLFQCSLTPLSDFFFPHMQMKLPVFEFEPQPLVLLLCAEKSISLLNYKIQEEKKIQNPVTETYFCNIRVSNQRLIKWMTALLFHSDIFSQPTF